MKTVNVIALSLILLVTGIKQSHASNSEIKTAKEALIKYLKAGDNSNVEILNQLMHSEYRVIFKNTQKDEVNKISRDSYLDFIEKKIFGGKKRTIDKIEGSIQGNTIASFEVVTNSESGTMHSYFSLIKVNEKWLILQDLVYM